MAANAEEVLYRFAHGPMHAPGAEGPGIDDVFCIASMTKAITALAAAQMLERGKLSLDQEAADIVPELRRQKVLTGFDGDGRPRFREPARPITVRHLFTHTSGHASDIWSGLIQRYAEYANLPPLALCKMETLIGWPLIHDPGEQWEYGTSLDWLGQVVERLSGKRLEQYFKENIFEPVGMDSTSFILSADQRRRLVPIYARGSDGAFAPFPFEISQEPEFYMGGAGLYGSVADYIKFLQMWLNRGKANGARVLKPETVELFLANHLDIEVQDLKSVLPALSADVALLPGRTKKWSLGFMVNVDAVEGGRSAGSQFWGGLASSYFWLDPSKNLAGLAMMSYLPFGDPAGLEVFNAFERNVYAVYG